MAQPPRREKLEIQLNVFRHAVAEVERELAEPYRKRPGKVRRGLRVVDGGRSAVH